MNLKFTPIARDDLENIWEFIAKENLSAATRICSNALEIIRVLNAARDIDNEF